MSLRSRVVVQGSGSPPGLMDDDGLRFPPGPKQPIDVLLLMKGVAAAPVDESDVWIRELLTVEVQWSTGVEQHVREARHWDKGIDSVVACR